MGEKTIQSAEPLPDLLIERIEATGPELCRQQLWIDAYKHAMTAGYMSPEQTANIAVAAFDKAFPSKYNVTTNTP